jgi:hypothetical protein
LIIVEVHVNNTHHVVEGLWEFDPQVNCMRLRRNSNFEEGQETPAGSLRINCLKDQGEQAPSIEQGSREQPHEMNSLR